MIFVGDTHGIRPIFNIIEYNSIRGSNLIHVGDFGLGFQDIIRDVKNLLTLDEMLLETNNILYVIRGNHDCPIFWDKSKGLNLPKFKNLRLIEDYSVINIENKNILFIGGAISIDRQLRKEDFPYPSWWEDEVFNFNEKLLENNIKNKTNIDIVVTHTAPMFVFPKDFDAKIVKEFAKIENLHGRDLIKELKEEREILNNIYNIITSKFNYKPKHWVYGHFHQDEVEVYKDTEFTCLGINKIKEI